MMYRELPLASPTVRPLEEMIAEAHTILDQALEQHTASHVFALFSGGNDSSVLGHVMRARIDALVHIDTGTALPGVRGFVHSWAGLHDIPLKVYEAGDAFLQMVLGGPLFWQRYVEYRDRIWKRHSVWISPRQYIEIIRHYPQRRRVAMGRAQAPQGFPGPAGHRFAYIRLKERQINALVREHKAGRSDRIVLLTGVRQAESQRRMGTTSPIQRNGAQVWVSPIVNWTNDHMAAYRKRFQLPQSDVAALIHRSGECNCGAFAKRGEREELALWFPEWDAQIRQMEAVARWIGHTSWRWGAKTPHASLPAAGPMCSDCTVSHS